MNRDDVAKLYEAVSQCACVGKGESDDRDVFLRFKVVCGNNVNVLKKLIDTFNKECLEYAKVVVLPDYDVFCSKVEKLDNVKKIKALKEEYADAIKTFEDYEVWLKDYIAEEITLPELGMWSFNDLPEKISGGFIVALKPVISDYPDGL